MNQNTDLAILTEAFRAVEAELRGKEFFISAVLDRMNSASAAFPHDQAISTLQFVLEKRADREGSLALISQGEIAELYQDVAGLGNQEAFRKTLGDLLPGGGPPKVAHYNERYAAGLRNGGDELQVIDPSVGELMYGLFEEQGVKAAKGSFVDNGRRGVEIELEAMGFGNPDVEVVARNGDFVIYAAAIDSSHGRVSAYVPAEVKLGSVLMPSVFVSGNDFVELTKDNLMEHAQEVAMGKQSASPNAILKTLDILAGKQSSTKQAIASDENSPIPLTVPELYTTPVEETEPWFEAPKVAMPKALEHLTEGQIRDVLAETGLAFGRDIVMAAKVAVATELKAAGIQVSKVSIGSEFAGGLVVVANLVGKGGHKTIEVPVEVLNGRVLSPSVFSSGGLAQPFDGISLRAFAADEGAGKFSAILSNKYGMSFTDLHSLMLRNAAHGNFVEVEETLAVIAEQFGSELHKVAHDDLLGLLNIGYGPEDKPIDAMDRYIQEAADAASTAEGGIHVSASVRMLYPGA